MAITAKISIEAQDVLGSLRKFFEDILNTDDIEAILVPQQLPMKNMVMPTLVAGPSQLGGVDPLAPAFPMNAARIVSRLARKPMGGKIAAVLRPCEIRAFIELVKLKQGRTDELVLIGIDCLGAFQNKDYFQFAGQNPAESTLRFYRNVLQNKGKPIEGLELAPACRACEYPVAENADILIGLYGMELGESLLVQSKTESGDHILQRVKMPLMR
jgi:formate dehydrogenase subunit beta